VDKILQVVLRHLVKVMLVVLVRPSAEQDQQTLVLVVVALGLQGQMVREEQVVLEAPDLLVQLQALL
jgi:hypothetical protein